MLRWCGVCKERSVVQTIRTRKRDGARVQYSYCANRGHVGLRNSCFVIVAPLVPAPR